MDTKPVKPVAGYRSSEFIAMLLTIIGMIWGAVDGALPPETAATIAAVAIGIYTACRSVVKAAHALGYAKEIPELPELPGKQLTSTVPPRQGGYAKCPLLATIGALGLVLTLGACVTPRSPAQIVYELEGSYAAALTVAVAYKKLPPCEQPAAPKLCAKADIVTKVQAADKVAFAALDAAKVVVTTPGMGVNTETAVTLAEQAVKALISITNTIGASLK